MNTEHVAVVAGWDSVEDYVSRAVGMCWDTCHKIYVIMDKIEVATMEKYGYTIEAPDMWLLREWFDLSCPLRFVEAINFGESGYTDFTNLIPQFFEDPDDYDDEEDEDYA